MTFRNTTEGFLRILTLRMTKGLLEELDNLRKCSHSLKQSYLTEKVLCQNLFFMTSPFQVIFY